MDGDMLWDMRGRIEHVFSQVQNAFKIPCAEFFTRNRLAVRMFELWDGVDDVTKMERESERNMKRVERDAKRQAKRGRQ